MTKATEHCIVNGKRCSKCCEVLTIGETKSFREWSGYVRNYGYPDNQGKGNRVFHMLRKISKRRAKKINPFLVGKIGNSQSYFTCKNLTSDGCGDYEGRPYMCSGFPYYGKTEIEYKESGQSALYSDACTYNIPIQQVD